MSTTSATIQPTPPLPDYELVTSLSDSELSYKVTEKLRAGWRIHGSPFRSSPMGSYAQAVVRNYLDQ